MVIGIQIPTGSNFVKSSLTDVYFFFFQELPPDALQEHKALIRKLQTQLRNEEMSLVLLKKIRQSQVRVQLGLYGQ